MKKYIWMVTLFCAVCIACANSLVSAAGKDTTPKENTLVICRVSDNPKKHIKQMQPIVDYVVSKMGHLGIIEGKVLFARDNREVLNFLKQGKIDWLTETPFSAITFQEKGGAEPFLLRWKKGVDKYHTIFFARKDSGIKSLADLKGKKIAFEDRGSTSGFLLPVSTMIQAGLQVTELASPREEVPAGMAGFVFSNQEMNSSNMVFRSITDAAVLSNLDWKETDRINTDMKAEMEIFHRTRPVPRALELVRGNLDEKVKEALKTILLQVDKDPAAKEVLVSYKKTKKFEEISEMTAKEMENVKELAHLIRSELD